MYVISKRNYFEGDEEDFEIEENMVRRRDKKCTSNEN